MSNMQRLISIASEPLNSAPAEIGSNLLRSDDGRISELGSILAIRNGFFCFESALRVFPDRSSPKSMGLTEWNRRNLWINDYEGLADDMLFFAEDILGGQFCIHASKIFTFDPETGDIEFVAGTLDEWAAKMLISYNELTAYPLARAWQEAHGKLDNRFRLCPKTPFACGGSFDMENLFAIEAVSGMRSRANLALQIAGLEDGQEVEFTIIE